MSPRLHVVSLGCAKNQVDTEIMLGSLSAAGCTCDAGPADADVLLVNTCAFIKPARDEAVAVIRPLARAKRPGQKLIVCGCLAQIHRAQFEEALPGVDAWIPIRDEKRIVDIVGRWFPVAPGAGPARRVRLAPRHSAYLRIADGCSHRCAFCTIPAIRGRYRSVAQADLLREASCLADEGVVELNLIAQDSGAYGRDLAPRSTLAALLRKLCAVPGIEWIRVQYLHPATVTADLLAVMASEPKICPYIDLPLQHCADRILRSMHRPGRAFTSTVLDRIRARLPHVSLRTTFITGYPGETEAEFAQLVRFVTRSRFQHVGVFPFVREKGTEAYQAPGQVPARTKRARRNVLMRLQQRISLELNRELVGETIPVLIDSVAADGPARGRRRGDAPGVDNTVHVAPARVCRPGAIVPVLVERALPYDLFGSCVMEDDR